MKTRFLLCLLLVLAAGSVHAAKRSKISFSVSGFADISHVERTSDTNPNYSIDSNSGTTILAQADFNFTKNFSLFAFGGPSTFNYESSPSRTINKNDGDYTNMGGGLKLTFGDFSFALLANSKPVLFLEDITSAENTLHLVDNTYGAGQVRFAASSTFYELAIQLEGGSAINEVKFQTNEIKSVSYIVGEAAVIFGSNGKGSSDNSIGAESDFLYGFKVRVKQEGYSYNGDDFAISDQSAGVFIALN